MKTLLILTTTIILTLLAGCSTVPERIDVLEQARAAVSDAEQNPLSTRIAGNELEQARDHLDRADEALDERKDLELIRHDAYLALRHAEIVEQRVEEARLRERIEDSEAERSQVLLQARERDALAAESLARASARDAERAEAAAIANARAAELNAIEAELAKAEAADAVAEARRLEQELDALKAEQTERGMVLTLGDVLFDYDKAVLKPGAEKTMERLAGFLSDYPERHLLIEGHTDARGDDAYNRDLSKRRANAVRDALIQRGISPARLSVMGMGESYPVATNDTVAGRQENRRVEIIISAEDGTFPEEAQREVAQY